MLAMHMANELLSPSVALAFGLMAAVAVGLASRRTARGLEPAKVPLMGVMGAFVFAAQMVNFTLPLMPGTSGHLGGGVLLAILLGPHAATLVMTAVLIIQCLIFQDGGLLALGTNIVNMAVLPCYVGYGIFRLIVGGGRGLAGVRLYAASFVAAMVGVVLGAACVPMEAALSGVVTVPLRLFVGTMVGVHLIIGAIEGLISFAVVAYLWRVRPDAVERAGELARPGAARASWPVVVGSLGAVAIVLAGLISHVASSRPDGLEWTYADRPDQADFKPYVRRPEQGGVVQRVERWQQRHALLPDYGGSDAARLTLGGLGGTGLTLVMTYLLARALGRRRSAGAA